MKKYLAGLAAVSVAGAAAPTMDTVQAAPEQTAQQSTTQTVQAVTKSSKKYTVTADVLRVRTGPSTAHDITSRVYEGQTLNVIGQENGWFKINHNGKIGYVSGEFVTAGATSSGSKTQTNPNVQPASGNYTVTVSSLRVRTGPSTSHTQLGSVHKGQVVGVVGEVQDWFKINYGGQTAYVSKDYVTKGGSNANTDNQQQQNNNNVTVQTGGTYVVNATSLRVRTGPAAYHSIIGGVLNGHTLNVVGVENGWFKVKHNGNTGYVSSEFVKFVKGGTSTSKPPSTNEETPAQGSRDYYVNASALNVRSGAGTNYGVIGALPHGQKIQVLAYSSSWSKVNYNGRTGYVGTRFLSKTPVSSGQTQKPADNNNTSNNAGNTSSVLAYAKSMIGVPYVWGGTSASGVDCSGYIYHVYKKLGYSISRQTVAGYWSSFQRTSNPQPGDLIYFQNTYKPGPSHMGIYLGGGTFIQAGDNGVQVASLNNSYWSKHFLGYSKPH